MTPEQIAAAIENAFYEGFGAYETACVPHRDVDFMWAHSEAKATADRILKEAQAQLSGNAGEVDAVERDAARWAYIERRVCASGSTFTGKYAFHVINMPDASSHMMDGDIGKHFGRAIDAAIAASKGANHG